MSFDLKVCCHEIVKIYFGILIISLMSSSVFALEGVIRWNISAKNLDGAVNASELNKPLKNSDRVVAVGSHFYIVGEDLKSGTGDDKRVKFFGVNLVGLANFPTKAEAENVAVMLAKLGVNIVRLHHLDTFRSEKFNKPSSILTEDKFPTFDMQAIDRLRNFIDALKSRGIYVDLNLHVGFGFRPDVDGVPGYLDDSKLPRRSIPLLYFNQPMIQAQEKYIDEVINLLGLKNNPVLALVEINNEGGLIDSWIDGKLAQAIRPPFLEDFLDQSSRFGPFNKTELMKKNFSELDGNKRELIAEFLIDVEKKYYDRIRKRIRAAAGFPVSVTGTQINFGGELTLVAQQDMDFIDNHFYVDPYKFPEQRWSENNWFIKNQSLIGRNRLAPLLKSAYRRLVGKPYGISEFNQPWPNSYASELLPVVVSFALRQDWDYLIYFNLVNDRRYERDAPGGLALLGDQTRLAQFSQLARIFRTTSWASEDWHVNRLAMPDIINLSFASNSAVQKYFMGSTSRLDNAVDGFVGVQFDNTHVSNAEIISKNEDKGEAKGNIDYNNEHYAFWSQQILGLIGEIASGESVNVGPVNISVIDRSYPLATIISSLDFQPIQRSNHLLITTVGPTFRSAIIDGEEQPELIGSYPYGVNQYTAKSYDRSNPSGPLNFGKGPSWLAVGKISLRWRSIYEKISVFPLDERGHRLEEIKDNAIIEDGNVILHLNKQKIMSPWFEVILTN